MTENMRNALAGVGGTFVSRSIETHPSIKQPPSKTPIATIP
jgi:hypothetical protein